MFNLHFSRSAVRWVAASLVVGSLLTVGFASPALAAHNDCDASWYIGSVSGNTATVTMTPDTHWNCDVYLTSWKRYDPLPGFQTQVKFDQVKEVAPREAGTPITFSVEIPDCAWQVDLSSEPVNSAADYNSHNLIDASFGGGALCGETHNPHADIKANGSDGPISIDAGTPVQISWTSHDVDSCTVTPGNWTGISGNHTTGNLNASVVYHLDCDGQFGSASDTVTINVNPVDQCIAPTVSTQSATNVTQTSAKLHGMVNPNGTATTVYFEYGTTTGFGQRTANQTFSGSTSQPVEATISGLQANTLYFFRIVAVNSCGGANAVGLPFNFTTTNNIIPAPTVEIRANGDRISTTIQSGTSAEIVWKSENTIACTVSPIGWSGTSGKQQTGNLFAPKTYTVNCTGENQQNVYDSVTVNIIEDQCIAPTVNTQAPTSVTQTSATLNGTVTLTGSRSTSVRFEYGTTSSLGQQTISQNFNTAGSHDVHIPVSNLQPNTTYYFRLVATNSCGGNTLPGSTLNFITTGNASGSPSAEIRANGQRGVVQVQYNSSANITWDSHDVDSCTVQPTGWTGLASNGHATGAITGTITYYLTCTGQFGPASDSVTVQASNNQGGQPPAVNINAYPSSINNGQNSVLTWNSTNATNCWASSGPWTGTKSLSGSETVYPYITSTYEITCQNTYGSAAARTTVFVNNVGSSNTIQVTKLVRNITLNQFGFSQNADAQGGDTLEFEIRVRNTDNYGRTITVQDILPQELYYVPNSTTVNGAQVNDGITTNGLNLGWVNANEEKVIHFRTTVFTGTTDRQITNQATANGSGGSANTYVFGNAFATVQLRNRGTVLGVSDISTGPENALMIAIVSGFITSLALFLIAKRKGWLDLLPVQYGGKQNVHGMLLELSKKANASYNANLK